MPGFASESAIPKTPILKSLGGDPQHFPGDMSYPYPIHEVNLDFDTHDVHHVEPLFRNDLIVEIIEQIDEQMILGYLEQLVAFGPRVTETPACEQAAAWIYNEFDSMKLDVRYHNWSNGGYESQNVEATLPGTDPSSDEIYIICGHYDSVPGSPGADDDGSGTVAVLAAAAILSQYSFDYTIRFVTFSGEEQGLLGSEIYAQDAYNSGDNIVAVLNVDMIGFAITTEHGSNIKIFHNEQSYWLVDYSDDIAEYYDDYIDLNVIPSGFTWGSDHYYFWEYGYDALFYHEYEFNTYYHSPDDTIEHMNLTYDVKCTRLIIAALASLSSPTGMSNPPSIPTQPDGPTEGDIYAEYTFSTSSEDPELDGIYYKWDWGDGTTSSWEGPYESGVTAESTHYWQDAGTYELTVKAQDDNGSLSTDWSNPLSIEISYRPPIAISLASGLGVTAFIENIVDVDLEQLEWSIVFDGGIILIQEGTTGTIDVLSVGDTAEIHTERLFGIGLPIITVQVNEMEESVRCLLFGPFVLTFG